MQWKKADLRVSKFNAQEIAPTLWAFTAVERPDGMFVLALLQAAVRRMREFSAQALVNTA